MATRTKNEPKEASNRAEPDLASKPAGEHASKKRTRQKDRVKKPTEPRITKLELLVDLLNEPQGATIAELSEATGWQAHSIRGALAGALKRKGHVVSSDVVGGLRRYRNDTPQ